MRINAAPGFLGREVQLSHDLFDQIPFLQNALVGKKQK
jgi:hypothetical protein